ncbi:formate dehydrogenase accessory protein FdhE [Lichenifustis flavocetrariae]|uniref:Protein FdhE homolog n=1 Tax=Lichenifustis flavocetrariae TaxID=2949735 RepID=A0AA41YY44_9HYPH|nr:formate dehydrogenase accessory protein FdhE [Lichenifustis flavocetrariae]MCW6509401.1 formate dehydrogenase accessory protein FdhE [Lichenifustis flavocetrariae]
MAEQSPLQPDPSMVGGVSKAPFVLPPGPLRIFTRRADRFDILASTSKLAPYLNFLGALTRAQASLVATLPALPPPDAAQIERARAAAMPPIDRASLATAPDLATTFDRLFEAAATIEMPAAAAQALSTTRQAEPGMLRAMTANVLADAIPRDSLAPHLFVAAGIQVHAARCAAALDPSTLVPIAVGVCPACGGPPGVSVVVGFSGAEGARYAVCSCCSTSWNEVRVKCIACGSTQGIGYRDTSEPGTTATVKAEVCDHCHSWIKILYQNQNPSLDPVADDVASLGLDMLMRGTDYRAAGSNPFMLGY